MDIVSHNPNDAHYWNDSHTDTGDHEPTGINNKVASLISNQETVCGFMLYRDSATNNGQDWDISPDFALPGSASSRCCGGFCNALQEEEKAAKIAEEKRFIDHVKKVRPHRGATGLHDLADLHAPARCLAAYSRSFPCGLCGHCTTHTTCTGGRK